MNATVNNDISGNNADFSELNESPNLDKLVENDFDKNDLSFLKQTENIQETPNIDTKCNNNPTELEKDTNENKSETENTPVKYFNGVEISKLTKRQMKKYQKVLKWQSIKKEKRAKDRLKTKKRKHEAKQNNVDLGPSRKQLKRAKMENSPCKIGVAIDLSFDHLMIDKDMGKVIKQILRVYTENRRAKAPMQLHLTSFDGRAKAEMAKHHGYENWDMYFHPESYLEAFPKEKLVYLTSESDNVITELREDKIYIIGGLVDHNFHKVFKSSLNVVLFKSL